MAVVEGSRPGSSRETRPLDIVIGALAGAVGLTALGLGSLSVAEWGIHLAGANLTLEPVTGLTQLSALIVGAVWGGFVAHRQA